MRYFTLKEIILTVLSFFATGIACDGAKNIFRMLWRFLLDMIHEIQLQFSNLFRKKTLGKSTISFNKAIFRFLFDFVFAGVSSLLFMLVSYYHLDGQIRFFSIICFVSGIILSHITYNFLSKKGSGNKQSGKVKYIIIHWFFALIFLPLRIVLSLGRRFFHRENGLKKSKLSDNC